MSPRPLPPLQVGTPYLVADFQSFEFDRLRILGEAEATLRLHLTNGTTLDLPTTDAELKRLLVVLCAAYGPTAIAHLKEMGWIE